MRRRTFTSLPAILHNRRDAAGVALVKLHPTVVLERMIASPPGVLHDVVIVDGFDGYHVRAQLIARQGCTKVGKSTLTFAEILGKSPEAIRALVNKRADEATRAMYRVKTVRPRVASTANAAAREVERIRLARLLEWAG